MVRPRKLRAPFVITLASVASTLAACGGSTESDHGGSGGSSATGGSGGAGNVSGSGGFGAVSGSGGSAATGGSGGTASCPPSFPPDSTPCSLPNGTSCSYDQGNCCPPWQAICQGGKWMALASSCNPPPPQPCPGMPPSNGAACSSDPCAPPASCSYGQCVDGSPLMIADCVNGAWSISIANCQPKPCEQLSACECFDRPDCEVLSDSCICYCDYNCPGDPPCDCACGGGQYLGCQTKNPFP